MTLNRSRLMGLFFVCSLLLVGILAATASGTIKSRHAKTYHIVMIPGSVGDEFYYTMSLGAKDAAKKLGVDLNIQFPTAYSASVQTTLLDSATATRPDAVLIAPDDSSALEAPLRQVASRGSKIILFDTTLKDTSFVAASITNQDIQQGEYQARLLAGAVHDKGTVLFISLTPGVSALDLWIQGFKQYMAAHAPKIKLLPIQYSNGDPTTAGQIFQQTYARYPDLAGVMAGNLVNEKGVAAAVRAAHAVGKVKVVAGGGTPQEVADLKGGLLSGLASVGAYTEGQRVIQLAVRVLNGEKVPKLSYVQTCAITKQNLTSPVIAPCLYRAIP